MKPILLISLLINLSAALRIPPNPCPDVFSYYKDRNGNVYGEAVIPYDGANRLQFGVNASFTGLFDRKVDLKAQLLTPPTSTTSGQDLKYYISFPSNLIPRITQLIYNGRVYCSGPQEQLSTSGVTNVWYMTSYFFTGPPRGPSNVEYNVPKVEDTFSDANLPVKDPMTNVVHKPLSPQITNAEKIDTSRNSENVFTSKPPLVIRQQCESFTILPLISGGNSVTNGQYPWLVAMFTYQEPSNNYGYKCTANLISDRYVITAGRCVQFYRIQVVKTQDIMFVFGRNDLTNWARSGAVTRGAVDVQVHPDFMENPNSAHADMAVIRIDEPISITKTIRPVCLWSNRNQALDQLVDKKGTVIGWGKEDNCKSATGSLHMLQSKFVDIPVVSQFNCLRSGAELLNITSEKTFCAGDRSGNGPCVGDSGAGIVFPVNGVYYLRGIASFITENNYAIFCDIAKFMPWISSKMAS